MTVDILADRDSHQRVAIAAMAERDYAEKMYRDTVAELDRCIADLREAEAYIAALRGPLLYHFGTTDPELLQEVWIDNHRGLCGKTSTSPEEAVSATWLDGVDDGMATIQRLIQEHMPKGKGAIHTAPRNATVTLPLTDCIAIACVAASAQQDVRAHLAAKSEAESARGVVQGDGQ